MPYALIPAAGKSRRMGRPKLSLRLGDRSVLDSYLNSVREIERRIERASQRDLSDIKLPPAPIGTLDSVEDQVKLFFDLIVLAYRAD